MLTVASLVIVIFCGLNVWETTFSDKTKTERINFQHAYSVNNRKWSLLR